MKSLYCCVSLLPFSPGRTVIIVRNADGLTAPPASQSESETSLPCYPAYPPSAVPSQAQAGETNVQSPQSTSRRAGAAGPAALRRSRMDTRFGSIRSPLPKAPAFPAHLVQCAGMIADAPSSTPFRSGQLVPIHAHPARWSLAHSPRTTRIRGIRHTVNGGTDARVNS